MLVGRIRFYTANMTSLELHEIIGHCGLYHIGVCVICCLSGLVYSFNSLGMVFLGASPKHWCSVPDLARLNLTLDQLKNFSIPLEEKDGQNVFSSCRMYKRNYSAVTRDEVLEALRGGYDTNALDVVGCNRGWQYDQSVYISTIVTKWDLVCDRQWMLAAANSVFMGGLLAGLLVSGALSDRVGRRKIMVVSGTVMPVTGILTAFAPSYPLYVCLRFILAMAHISMSTTGYVLVAEMVGDRYRTPALVLQNFPWLLGYMILPWIAYAVRDGFYLHLAYNIPSIIYLSYIVLAPESLRWLFVKGRVGQGDKGVRRIAIINRKQLPTQFSVKIKTEETKASVLDLFRAAGTRRNILICYFIWFVCSIVYYGILLNTTNVSGNPYLNTFIFACTGIPEVIFNTTVTHFVGRRILQCLGLALTGVVLLSTLTIPSDDSHALYRTLLALAGKAFISLGFCVIFIFTAELVPTPVRNVALGSGSIAARVGGIVAPYFVQIGQQSRLIPTITFGAVSIAAALSALFLPETKGLALPDTFEDMKTSSRKKSTRGNVANVREVDTMFEEETPV